LAIRRRPFYPRDTEDAEKIKSLNHRGHGGTHGKSGTFLLNFLGAYGVSVVNFKAETDARKAAVSVPRMGVVASGGWFE
jgi:hypothetical protein